MAAGQTRYNIQYSFKPDRPNRDDDDFRRNTFIFSPTCFSHLRAGNGGAHLNETPKGKITVVDSAIDILGPKVVKSIAHYKRYIVVWAYQYSPIMLFKDMDGMRDVLIDTEMEYATTYIVILARPQPSLSLQYPRSPRRLTRPYWFTDVRRASYPRMTFVTTITTAFRTTQPWGYMVFPRTRQSLEDLDLETLTLVTDRIYHLESEILTCNEEIKETQ
ncbi:hypothetical protein EDD85DRAFT_795572 [Armillaria nabsnona]|nr:hypothetical protein EDD85DRAFT_795572 [Armillaria nabsnona]